MNDYLLCCKQIAQLYSFIKSQIYFHLIELTSILNLCRILLQLNLYKVNRNTFLFHDKPNKAIEFQYNSKNEFNDLLLLLLLLHSENSSYNFTLFILKTTTFAEYISLTIRSCMFQSLSISLCLFMGFRQIIYCY